VKLDEIYLLIAQIVSRNGQFLLSPGMKQREANVAILSALTIMENKIKRLSK
jgi:hypothetical protein